ncbi:MAG: BMC domain-containing protein [Cellulosilyticaceae bacterium]
MTEALGLIEVIGYPPAIEAADAALKAANVKLGAVTRVDGGIVTIQILGDVGAVKAAVDAGSSAAERIGTVRAAHVIPRLESSLAGMLTEPGKGMRNLGPKHMKQNRDATTQNVLNAETMDQPSSPSQDTVANQTEIPVVSDEVERAPLPEVDMTEVSPEGAYIAKDIEEEIKPPVVGGVKKLTPHELKKMSNKELKNLITSLGIKVAAKKMKSAKKEDLIHMIIQFDKEGEN